jgi:N-methylhydantoinase B
MPERIPAASCGTMSSIALGGEGWTYYETIGGGSGAGPGFSGTSAVQCHMTNTLNTPAEAIELQYPLRVRRFERSVATGGHGEFPGGDGIAREIEILSKVDGTVLSDRRLTHPYGLSGGHPGSVGENRSLLRARHDALLPGKVQFTIEPGERLRIITPGGGGWGSPQASSLPRG